MTWWMWLIASLGTYGFGWYRSTLYLARRFNEAHERDFSTLTEDRYYKENAGMAMLAAILWPLVVPGFKIFDAVVPRVGPTRKQVEAENVRLRGEISRLERELGVGR